MYVHTREQDSRPGFDGVKINFQMPHYFPLCNIQNIYMFGM